MCWVVLAIYRCAFGRLVGGAALPGRRSTGKNRQGQRAYSGVMRWILEAGETLTTRLCHSAKGITTNFRDDALDGARLRPQPEYPRNAHREHTGGGSGCLDGRFPGRPIFPGDQDLASMARLTNAPGHHQR